jgi:streptomycin 6-kinase
MPSRSIRPDADDLRPSKLAKALLRLGDGGARLDGMTEVLDVVRRKAVATGAIAWLEALPSLVAALEREWAIEVGDAYSDSTEALVFRATCADGTPAVLKLLVPRSGDAARNEITALRLANGEGCVRLLRADASRGALLLERLGRPLWKLGLPIARRHEILCAAAARVWRPADGSRLPTGAEKARRLAASIAATWEELGRPCSERAIEHALTCADRRAAAHRDDRAVLIHGDVHQWNALEAQDGFKLVDPDGLLAEPEYDLGIIMREDPVELLDGNPFDRASWLAERTGLDATAIWEWGVVERVSTGLLLTKVHLEPVASQMLTAADRVAAQGNSDSYGRLRANTGTPAYHAAGFAAEAPADQHRARRSARDRAYAARAACENRSHADCREIPRASPMLAQDVPRRRASATHRCRAPSTCPATAAIRGSRSRTSWSVIEYHDGSCASQELPDLELPLHSHPARARSACASERPRAARPRRP